MISDRESISKFIDLVGCHCGTPAAEDLDVGDVGAHSAWCPVTLAERIRRKEDRERAGELSNGADDTGNEYELTDDGKEDEVEVSREKEEEEDLPIDDNPDTPALEGAASPAASSAVDPVISQIETKAKNLAYAITNPETLSRKLREELVSIVGPEAAITYHLSASFDSSSQQVKFQIARLSPSTVFRLKSDLHTTEVGFAYIKTINGWRVAVGLTANAATGDDPVTRVRAPQGSGDGVDVAGSFSVTVSR